MRSSFVGSHLAAFLLVVICGSAAAPNALAVPTPLHSFDFDGSYADSVSGTPITAEGGALVGSRHEFDPQRPAPAAPPSLYGPHNQGLTLSNPGLSNPGIYSIEMYVRYDTINNISAAVPDWLKLIDFKNGGESLGIYYVDAIRSPKGNGVADTSSVFRFTYAPGGPPKYEDSTPVMTPGKWLHLVLTRDAADDAFGYVNGQLAFTVDDSLKHGVFDSPGNVMRFFQNDLPSNTGAYYAVGKGGVDFLKIYDVALTPSDVATLAAAVPEPSTGLLILIMGVFGAAVRRQIA